MSVSVRRPNQATIRAAGPLAELRDQWLSIVMLLLAATAIPASAAEPSVDRAQLDQAFPRSSLKIATLDARLHPFDIWIADTDQRRARGLMFVKQLDAGTGMLFIYPGSHTVAMWMKNTFIPLDMLFVNAAGRVVKVVENTEPQSLKTIESGQPVRAVIELSAGTAGKLHISAGAQVMHPLFTDNP